MKALTICQPYAHLITLPLSDPRHKRVENRRWGTQYRGELLVHAGKSVEYLSLDETNRSDEQYEIPVRAMAFGAGVAVAELAGVVWLIRSRGRSRPAVPAWAAKKWPWLDSHAHLEGPACWVLENVRPLAKPISMSGRQGLWDVPEEIAERIRGQGLEIAE